MYFDLFESLLKKNKFFVYLSSVFEIFDDIAFSTLFLYISVLAGKVSTTFANVKQELLLQSNFNISKREEAGFGELRKNTLEILGRILN